MPAGRTSNSLKHLSVDDRVKLGPDVASVVSLSQYINVINQSFC